MIVLLGTYKFGTRVVGYKNDFCNSCNTGGHIEKVRWFNVIKLLPNVKTKKLII